MSRFSIPIDHAALPITQSHQHDEMEEAMAAVFHQLLSLMHTSIDDHHHYGTPYLGSRQVVERFTTLNGLAVLRRRTDKVSDKIMAIILQNYLALASERGVAFLKFVLDMLYPGQSELVQLWHSKANISEYPVWVYDAPRGTERFLTSRLRIYMQDSVDAAELAEIAPVFRKLVPWHITPEIAFRLNAKVADMGVAVTMQTMMVINFSPEVNGRWGGDLNILHQDNLVLKLANLSIN